MMARKKMVRTLCAVGALTVAGLSQSAFGATTVTSLATGLAATLSIADLINVNVGPVDLASGTAPTPYASNQQVLTLNSLNSLVLGSFGATTGVIVDTASSGYLPTLSGTATSTVNGLGAGFTVPLVGSLLDVSATTLTSTSTASDFGGLALAGSTGIENLYISGLALGANGIHLNASALASVPVNDILFAANGLIIVANYQTPIMDGSALDGIQTTALAIGLDRFAFGTGLLSGTVLIADSAASIPGAPVTIVGPPAAVPEPSAWAMMLVGMGLIGAAIRRRRSPAMLLAAR